MSSVLVAQFADVEALLGGVRHARDEGFSARDALTPYPIAAIIDLIPHSEPRLRLTMALSGFGVALFAFALQTWSAVVAYPFNSGGRPYFSWPVFLLVPFEVGVLAAGIAGFIAFLRRTGLPRLHHSIFDLADIERASQDRFFLIFDHPQGEALSKLEGLMLAAGALSVAEAGA